MKKITFLFLLCSSAAFGQWDSVKNGFKGGYPFGVTVYTQAVYNGNLYLGGSLILWMEYLQVV